MQRSLLEALLKTGKPVVLTLFTGRPLTLTWEQEHVPAILNVWFGGSEAAYAIGDVLFGDVNPSGKLTMTFPKNVGQIPLFYNHKNTGRPLAAGKWFEKFRSNYLDVDNEPLYPFGYGLSYTTFRYSDIALSTPSMGQDGSITAAVTVTNTGKRDGAEVVQLYIRDLVGSITRPVRELKGFEKIFLRAGESKTVSFKITPELLRFYDYDLNHVAEPGDFDLFIGGSSPGCQDGSYYLEVNPRFLLRILTVSPKETRISLRGNRNFPLRKREFLPKGTGFSLRGNRILPTVYKSLHVKQNEISKPIYPASPAVVPCRSLHKESDGASGALSDDALLDTVQRRTFNYFWDGAEPNSGLARERIHMDGVYPENDQNVSHPAAAVSASWQCLPVSTGATSPVKKAWHVWNASFLSSKPPTAFTAPTPTGGMAIRSG